MFVFSRLIILALREKRRVGCDRVSVIDYVGVNIITPSFACLPLFFLYCMKYFYSLTIFLGFLTADDIFVVCGLCSCCFS